MSRIRTIKPEFWTDETMVQLPYEARLLFVGLWNFCDDEGLLSYEPERIRMQVLPGDDIQISELLDLLVASERLEVLKLKDGSEALKIPHFLEHQKISHPTPSKLSPNISGKLVIPAEVRRQVALKHGCKPGEHVEASCYYCGSPGSIWWAKTQKGKPSFWVAFGDLELDHFEAESQGGENKEKNIVLACMHCNRSKGIEHGFSFLSKNLPEYSGTFPPDGKGIERIGKERIGSERKGEDTKGSNTMAGKPSGVRFDDWWKAYPKKAKKKQSREIWKRKRLDSKADDLIADVQNREQNDDRWQRGFVPDPTTYLNGERWQDDIEAPKKGNGKVPPLSDEAGMKQFGTEHGAHPKPGESWYQYRERLVNAIR
jgi:5-methylcytosine-specific restriction endonuclease McrA